MFKNTFCSISQFHWNVFEAPVRAGVVVGEAGGEAIPFGNISAFFFTTGGRTAAHGDLYQIFGPLHIFFCRKCFFLETVSLNRNFEVSCRIFLVSGRNFEMMFNPEISTFSYNLEIYLVSSYICC